MNLYRLMTEKEILYYNFRHIFFIIGISLLAIIFFIYQILFGNGIILGQGILILCFIFYETYATHKKMFFYILNDFTIAEKILKQYKGIDVSRKEQLSYVYIMLIKYFLYNEKIDKEFDDILYYLKNIDNKNKEEFIHNLNITESLFLNKIKNS